MNAIINMRTISQTIFKTIMPIFIVDAREFDPNALVRSLVPTPRLACEVPKARKLRTEKYFKSSFIGHNKKIRLPSKN
jgi:hypothetical protein